MIFLIIRRLMAKSHRPAFRLTSGLFAAVLLNFIFALGFYFAECGANPELTFADSMWWAMVTMTTVGYGDYYPVTWVGRFLVAYPCFILGIGLIGYLLGTIAEIVLETFNQRKKGLKTMKFSDHLIVCHCPATNKVIQVVLEYRANKQNVETPAVVICNRLTECPAEFTKHDIHWVKGVSAMEETLHRAGVTSADGVIVLAEDPMVSASDAQSFAAASLVNHMRQSLDAPPQLIVEVVDRENLPMMDRAGVDGIVPISGFSERLLVQELVSPGLRRVFDQLISYHKGSELYILSHRLPEKPFSEIQIDAIHHTSNIVVLGRIRDGVVQLPPPKSDPLKPTDELVVLADCEPDFRAFENSISSGETNQ